MNILQYLILLGVVQLIFYLIQWLITLLMIPFVLLKIDRLGTILVKIFNFYLYVSILGILTLTVLEGNSSVANTFIIVGAGLFVIFLTSAQSMAEAEKQANQNLDYQALHEMRFDGYFIFGALAYFIVVMFFPFIANTLLVQILISLIRWVYDLPIIGALLGIFGLLYMLSILFQVFIFATLGLSWLLGRFKQKTGEEKMKLSKKLGIKPIYPDK
jgi:hypothetical protein